MGVEPEWDDCSPSGELGLLAAFHRRRLLHRQDFGPSHKWPPPRRLSRAVALDTCLPFGDGEARCLPHEARARLGDNSRVHRSGERRVQWYGVSPHRDLSPHCHHPDVPILLAASGGTPRGGPGFIARHPNDCGSNAAPPPTSCLSSLTKACHCRA